MIRYWTVAMGLAALAISAGCVAPEAEAPEGTPQPEQAPPVAAGSPSCEARIEIARSQATVPPLALPPGSTVESVIQNGTGTRCVSHTTAGIVQAELWAAGGTAATVGPVPIEWQGQAYDVFVPQFLRTVTLTGEPIAQGVPTNSTMVLSHPRLGDLIAKIDADLSTSISVSDAEATEALTVLGFATNQPGQGMYEVQLGENAYRIRAMW